MSKPSRSGVQDQYLFEQQQQTNNREVLTAHVGQAGCRLGFKFWEILAMEHGINKDGTLIDHVMHHNLQSLFTEVLDTSNGVSYFMPRAIFVDLEPSVINLIMTSEWKNFFERSQMVNGYRDSLGNIARARGSIGSEIINSSCEVMRIMLGACEVPHSGLMTRAAAGGCGGGITPEICEYLNSHLHAVVVNEIVPHRNHSGSCVESFNYILSTAYAMPYASTLIKFDNYHLYRMLDFIQGLDFDPTISRINALTAHPMSNLVGFRFENQIRPSSISSFQTNLQPFPSLKHITPGFAPLVLKEAVPFGFKFTPLILLKEVFQEYNSFIDIDEDSKIICTGLTYRGNFTEDALKNAELALVHDPTIGFRERFVDWNTAVFKCNVLTTPVSYPDHFELPSQPKTVFKYSNEVGIKEHYMEWLDKYCALLNRGAFTEAYMKEGMELSEFQAAFENVKQVCVDYGAAIEGHVLGSDDENDE